MKKNPYEQLKERQNRARQRQIERQRKKMNDPKEKEKRQLKAREAALRQRERQAAKLSDPEYIEKQRQKQRDAIQRKRERKAETTKSKLVVKKVSKPKAIKSKGLVGRTPTAEEKRVMDAIGALPCIACLLKGRYRPLISLHHLDGRIVIYAHMKVLPLCAEHHDTPADPLVIAQYPDLIPYHARGRWGGKAAWRAENGCEYEMLAIVFKMVGIEPPFDVPDVDIDVSILLSYCA